MTDIEALFETADFTENESREVLKSIALNDFFVFCRFVMGYDLVNELEHRPLCDFLQGPRSRVSFVIASRDTLKTTIVHAYALWLNLKSNSRLRILFDSRAAAQAAIRLDHLKTKIEREPVFRGVFGEQNGSTQGFTWNQEALDLASRTDNSAKEKNFEISAEDKEKTGFHYNVIISDDFLTKANAFSVELNKKTLRHISALGPLLSQRAGELSEMIFVGTPYVPGDALEQLLDIYKDNCSVYYRRAYEPEDMDIVGMTETEFFQSGGRLNFPTCLPFTKLKDERIANRNDISFFMSQYQLKSISASDLAFNYARVNVIKFTDLPRGMMVSVLCDPAGDPMATGAKKDSDYNAIAVIGILKERADDPLPKVYIIDVRAKRENPSDTVKAIVDIVSQYNPALLGIERGSQSTTYHYVEQELRVKNKMTMMIPLLPKGRSKELRICGLEPVISTGNIYVVDSCYSFDDLMSQIRLMTRTGAKTSHDDCIDVVSYVLDVISEFGCPVLQTKEPEEDVSHLNCFELQHYNYWKNKINGLSEEEVPLLLTGGDGENWMS